MFHNGKLLDELKNLTAKVEDNFLSDEAKPSFGDLLKLVEHRDLGSGKFGPSRIEAGWCSKKNPDVDVEDAAA